MMAAKKMITPRGKKPPTPQPPKTWGSTTPPAGRFTIQPVRGPKPPTPAVAPTAAVRKPAAKKKKAQPARYYM